MAIGTSEIFLILNIILIYAIPLAVVIYVIILAKRYVDAKAQESNKSTDYSNKIDLLSGSMDKVEKKLDKIKSILEKVSE